MARGRLAAFAVAAIVGTGAALGAAACGEDRGGVEVEGAGTGTSTSGTDTAPSGVETTGTTTSP